LGRKNRQRNTAHRKLDNGNPEGYTKKAMRCTGEKKCKKKTVGDWF